ncbi:MAG TPA: carboxymuconolactone decarboxylase family protein [Bryobacteraceae bacterium]|nr:carboxymuconolactone decarboxylase family protein [Bryobacteraceae bacterium]
MNEHDKPPSQLSRFESHYPDVWRAFSELAQACHDAGGPLDERSRRLVKLAIAVGNRHEGAVHSAVRQALNSGATPAELRHVAVLAITTIGWPAAHAALTWIEDLVGQS